ncbi:lysophospholipid acyltransferase family protein [Pseudochelatococcus contaminans]|uniref:DUF374 domain-containing protein n=1 Tax=Pseudochelatococcus contaminans TaxID=1538103 RepID=A0A7W5Z1P2_9HYPH|nr:lysophospholipid acyltransferase family protein [Pseudochelatococcus contaminans]MBB3808224.1 hypothetical protein [Pseudochelatococcus contaminans]
MALLKRITRSRPVQATLGALLAGYLRLVRATSVVVTEPADLYEKAGQVMPVIVAMWHGQHFMVPFARRPQDPAAALVSRSGDGEFNALALQRLGIRPIRGSGARARARMHEKGGVAALRGLLRALADGELVVLTADVPKVSRQCGQGIVLLARLSGRPIVPVAVVSSRRIDFKSWDNASIGLPFGRIAMVVGEPLFVPADADDDTLEAVRISTGQALDAVHERAYSLVGAVDPGGSASRSAKSRSAKSRSAKSRSAKPPTQVPSPPET